jgi:hypothetical protein
MQQTDYDGVAQQQPPPDGDRLEIIRFPSDDAQKEAIGVLRQRAC